jgi:hypothetical protein
MSENNAEIQEWGTRSALFKCAACEVTWGKLKWYIINVIVTTKSKVAWQLKHPQR